jgi:ATP-dependent helicase/nuclease subunit A
MTALPHEIIRASAGTGKTYQLVNRYLRILLATGEPERIIALTFTRKAAGEFFHKIFHALAEAAASDTAASALSRRLALAPSPCRLEREFKSDSPAPGALTAASCRAALRLLLARLHRLRLATYDSFFAGIVQSAPYELGLAGPAALIDEAQRDDARRRAQRALSALARRDPAVLDDFWHAFKRATMGADGKAVATQLDSYIAAHHSLYLDAPAASAWGSPARIWPHGYRWTEIDFDGPAAASALHVALPLDGFTHKTQLRVWTNFYADLAAWPSGTAIPENLLKLAAEKFAPHLDALPLGQATVTLGKATPISPAAGRILADLARHALGHVLARRLDATQGLHALLRQFEQLYGAATRRAGRLTIEDMTRLLAPPPADPGSAGFQPASEQFAPGLPDPALRAALDYRLDARFDHWLLDEFQDTSFAQWRAIANLVDEVVQDPEGARSFFAVGDAKQSIYLWRGSDPAIFERLELRYPGRLHASDLSRSFRSGPDVLALVNTVFTDRAAHAALFGETLAARWANIYQPHVPADKNADLPGHAALLLVTPPEDADADDREAARHAAVADLLTAINPLARGLSVAVLVRKNSAADALVEHLRAHTNLPCSLAANTLPGQDNALSSALLSFLQLAAHPGDTLAWQHLRLTPLFSSAPGSSLPAPCFHSAAAFSAHLLALAETGGMGALLDSYAALVSPLLPADDAFNHGRLALARAAAHAFDQRGDHDLDAFISHLRQLALREHDVPGEVAVMTIHKSKGLDWDLVILPDLEGNSLLESPSGVIPRRAPDGEIEWIINLPPKEISSADPTLAALVEDARNESGYENLCNLYVGLTRAKRALYLLTHPVKEKSTSAKLPRLLRDTLGDTSSPLTLGQSPRRLEREFKSSSPAATFACAWQSGDPAWFEKTPSLTTPPAPAAPPPVLPLSARAIRAEPRALRPSGHSAARLPARALFRADADRADFGSRIHKTLQRLAWLDTNSPHYASAIDFRDQPPDIAATIRALLNTPAIRTLFIPPPTPCDLWRETPFELVLGDRWISGQFDRVHLHRDATGRALRAEIIDFKTDRIATPESLTAATARHSPQLATYREALARLVGLPETAITARLVFTTTHAGPQLVTLPA